MEPIRKSYWRLDRSYNYWWEIKNMNKYLHTNGYNELQIFHDLTKKNKIIYWLTGGTLLGFYRDKKFISHDLDIDVAVHSHDTAKLLRILAESNFKITHGFVNNKEELTEISLLSKNVKIDVYFSNHDDNHNCITDYYKKSSDDVLYHGVVTYSPKIEEVIDEKFNGIEVSIPSNTVDCLISIYGPDFMTPNKNWSFVKDLYSAKYFSLSEYYGKRIEADEIMTNFSNISS